MATKWKTIGYITKQGKKADGSPKKPQLVLTESVTASRDKKVYCQLFEPRKGEKQTEDQFAAILEWKKFDCVVGTDE